MIDLYARATANGSQVSIMQEESVIAYRMRRIDLAAYPLLLRWLKAIRNRPALQRGMREPQ